MEHYLRRRELSSDWEVEGLNENSAFTGPVFICLAWVLQNSCHCLKIPNVNWYLEEYDILSFFTSTKPNSTDVELSSELKDPQIRLVFWLKTTKALQKMA